MLRKIMSIIAAKGSYTMTVSPFLVVVKPTTPEVRVQILNALCRNGQQFFTHSVAKNQGFIAIRKGIPLVAANKLMNEMEEFFFSFRRKWEKWRSRLRNPPFVITAVGGDMEHQHADVRPDACFALAPTKRSVVCWMTPNTLASNRILDARIAKILMLVQQPQREKSTQTTKRSMNLALCERNTWSSAHSQSRKRITGAHVFRNVTMNIKRFFATDQRHAVDQHQELSFRPDHNQTVEHVLLRIVTRFLPINHL